MTDYYTFFRKITDSDKPLVPHVTDIVGASRPNFGAIAGDRWTMNPRNINDSGHYHPPIPVGMPVTGRPPDRSEHALLTQSAPTSGV